MLSTGRHPKSPKSSQRYYPIAEKDDIDLHATVQLQRKTIYTPNSDGSKCSFFTSFSTVTGSNGISLLFGLHFSICKFFYMYIGHFYFFFTDCFDMPFAHFSSEIFVFLFICKMQKYLSKSLFLILEL